MIKLTVVVNFKQLLFISAVLSLVDRITFCQCSSPCLNSHFIFFASRETIFQLVLPVVLVLAVCSGFFRRLLWRIWKRHCFRICTCARITHLAHDVLLSKSCASR